MFDDSVILIDKPAGETSFETMRKVQRALKVKKAGHCGTLDRFASGLLVITTGKASRVSRFLLDSDKQYTAVVELGVDSPSHDPETPMSSVALPDDAFDKLESVLASFEGKQNQLPPVYSALKIQGKRASDRVRAGETVELKSRQITVYSLRLVSLDKDRNLFEIDVKVSKGTYIRSLARDIGKCLGTAAVLKSLVRTASGPFIIDDAQTPESLLADGAQRCVRTIEDALCALTRVEVSTAAKEKISHGALFTRDEVSELVMKDSELCLFMHEGLACAIARVDFDLWDISYLAVLC